jgi:hypothetical protein
MYTRITPVHRYKNLTCNTQIQEHKHIERNWTDKVKIHILNYAPDLQDLMKIANGSFENASQFKYLGTTVTNQNLIQEEIKRRLHSGNAYYHSVQNLLSSQFLSKN